MLKQLMYFVIEVTRKLMTISQYNGHSRREFDSELKV